jgi:hypothetical protein
MRRFPLGSWLLSLTGLLGLSGCLGVISGPVDVEAVVRDGTEGAYTLDVVTLRTPTDLLRGEGESLRYLRDFSFDASFRDRTNDVSAFPDIGDVVLGARTEAGGRLPEPQLAQQGDVIVAQDFDSLMLLSSWVAIERTFDLFIDLGNPFDVGTEPVIAALYGRVHGPLGIPSGGADNASYLSLADTMFIEPTFWIGKLEGALPLSANEGVIAHELGHRLFFFAFYRAGAPTTWRRELAEGFNNADERLLAAINEGVADLVGVAVTGDAGFGTPSALGEDRDLANRSLDDFLYQPMIEGSHPCNEGTPLGDPAFDIYCTGTVFALSVWEASNRDPDQLRAVLLPAVTAALTEAGERTEVATAGADEMVFDPRWLLEAIATHLDGAPRAAFCDAAERRFAHTDVDEAFLCP